MNLPFLSFYLHLEPFPRYLDPEARRGEYKYPFLLPCHFDRREKSMAHFINITQSVGLMIIHDSIIHRLLLLLRRRRSDKWKSVVVEVTREEKRRSRSDERRSGGVD